MSDAAYIYFNGEIVPHDEARIHVNSPAAMYGIGVFEGIRGYWNDKDREMYVFRLRDHAARLKQSMKLLRLEDNFSVETLESAVLDMIRANDFRATIQMRMMAVLADASSDRTDAGPTTIVVSGKPRPTHNFLETGLKGGTSSWIRTPDNALPVRIKCNANYVNARHAEMEAKVKGYDRAILLNSRGKVSEGPGSTLFVIRNGQPVTPGVTSDLLESITRESLMQLLQERLSLETVQREMDRTEIYTADEAFMCGTLAEVTPIVSLDGIPIGDGTVGPVTRALQKHYLDVAQGIDPAHAEWRTPVYGNR